MFQARVPEKLIKQNTGHQSLHSCEHTSVSQLVDASNVLLNDLVPPAVIQNYYQSSIVTSTSAISENPTSIMFKGCTFAG